MAIKNMADFYLERKPKEHLGKLQYKDLDLKSLREKCGIDFAHFTYQPGMCSCCFGPWDLPAKYWHNGVIKGKYDDEPISYILFKNADNGSGCVKRTDYLSDKEQICISWQLSQKQLNAVIKELKKQVGSEFTVVKPKDEYTCIILKRRKNLGK